MIPTNLDRKNRPYGHLTQQTKAVDAEPGDVGRGTFETNMLTAALLKFILKTKEKIKVNAESYRTRLSVSAVP